MRKRFKIVFNVEIDEPEKRYPGGGDYTHRNRLDGVVYALTSAYQPPGVTVSLDKVIDKGEIAERSEPT